MDQKIGVVVLVVHGTDTCSRYAVKDSSFVGNVDAGQSSVGES